jgi:hypothetical protein
MTNTEFFFRKLQPQFHEIRDSGTEEQMRDFVNELLSYVDAHEWPIYMYLGLAYRELGESRKAEHFAAMARKLLDERRTEGSSDVPEL